MSLLIADLAAPRCPHDRRRQTLSQIAHRRQRSITLGSTMHLQFEDAQTIRHQIQEVLRAERIADAKGIQQEIDTYAHLLPDGRSWKATLLLELPDAQQRRRELPLLNEAVHLIYAETADHARVIAAANEDQPDRHRGRLSAVHFLRFDFPRRMREAILDGSPVTLGCAHGGVALRRAIPAPTLTRLREDLRPSA